MIRNSLHAAEVCFYTCTQLLDAWMLEQGTVARGTVFSEAPNLNGSELTLLVPSRSCRRGKAVLAYVCIKLYIYRQIETHTHTHIYIYIYIYILCVYIV